MRIQNEDLVLSGTDMTSDITSDPVWLGHIMVLSVQTVYTGTPNGTLKLQGSNDLGSISGSKPITGITNWTDLGVSDSVSAAGSTMFNVADTGYRWFRLVWEDSSSGNPSTITSARFNVKGV